MTLYVHIGMQKTGSTFLQRALDSRRKRLKTLGLNYIHGLAGLEQTSPNHHHWLAHAILDTRYSHTPANSFDLFDQHIEALHTVASGKKTSLISSEDFSSFSAEHIDRFGDLLPTGTKILVYLRRQDFWFDSLFAQLLKVGRQTNYKDLLDENASRLDYSNFLEPWADKFGVENIVVRPYENFVGSLDLWEDFFRAIGKPVLSHVTPPLASQRSNVSLSPSLTEVARLLAPLQANRALRPYLDFANLASDSTAVLKAISQKQAAELLCKYAQSNATVAKTYLKSDVLFSDMSVAKPGQTDSDISNSQLIIALGGMIAKLAQNNEILTAELQDIKKSLK